MSLCLEVLPDDLWADHVAGRLSQAMATKRGIRICLATGNTTRPMYRRVAVSGEPVIFLLDEFGGLPPGDPARCEEMLRRDLRGVRFEKPDVDADDVEVAAERYGAGIRRGGLDLAVVGLGPNGHLGMNEPGSQRDRGTRVVELAEATSLGAVSYGASTSPTWGITVGIAEVLQAAEVWLVVTGPHKAEMLHRVMTAPIGPELPATFLRDHPNALVLSDQSAAPLGPKAR